MKKFYIILIIVLVLGLTWYITMQPKPSQEVIVPVPTEQTSTTTSEPQQGLYTNNTLGVSAQLPAGYAIDDTYKYIVNPQRSIDGVKFTIPTVLSKGTNLSSNSYVSIERVAGTKSCTADSFLDGSHTASTKTLNGITYSVATSSDAGAGNRYDESVFVLPRNNSCVAVRYFVHYTNIQNYDAGTVQEYNNAALMNQFDSIRDSVTINK